MVSGGFQWGFRPKHIDSFAGTPRYTPSINEHPNMETSNIKKRRLSEDENTPSLHPTPASKTFARKYPSVSKFKKSKTPRILGQTLPINRMIEVLDQKALQSLLADLVQIHPEISSTINSMAPKPSINNSVAFLKEKFNQIFTHLPYKCDTESDYSYLRIKPHLNEFLNCLSDFILHFLPPIESNISHSLLFLDHVTDLMHELPNFTNNEFSYTKSLAYEQIANAWYIVLDQKISHENSEQSEPISSEDAENSLKLIKIINDLNLEEKLQKHNQKSLGKFKVILEFIKSEINLVDMFNNAITTGSSVQSSNNGSTNGVLGDFITVDYSKFSITARTSH